MKRAILLLVAIFFICSCKGNGNDPVPTPPDPTKPYLTQVAETPYQGYFSMANVGNEFWAGTYSGGSHDRLYGFWPKRTIADLKTGEAIYYILECSTGGVLLGCEKGQLYYTPDKVNFELVKKTLAGWYSIIECNGYFYATAHRNNSPITVEIWRSSDKRHWSKVYSSTNKQLKAGAALHGVPQFFGYDFDAKYGIRLFSLDNGNTWSYQKIQTRTRYLDAYVEDDVCWLATCYMKGNTPFPGKGDMGPGGVAKLSHAGLQQVMNSNGQIGKTVKRSPYDGYLYFGEIAEWKGYKHAELWRSKTGDIGTWEKVITFTESEIIDQVFHEGKHYICTKQRGSTGKIYELKFK